MLFMIATHIISMRQCPRSGVQIGVPCIVIHTPCIATNLKAPIYLRISVLYIVRSLTIVSPRELTVTVTRIYFSDEVDFTLKNLELFLFIKSGSNIFNRIMTNLKIEFWSIIYIWENIVFFNYKTGMLCFVKK